MIMENQPNKQAANQNPTLDEPVTATAGSQKPPEPEQEIVDPKQAMRLKYMDSSHVEWAPFAREQGMDAVRSRSNYPVHIWIMEKRRVLAQREAEELAGIIFTHKSRWQREVLKTLKEYPEAHDGMMAIVKTRMKEMLDDVREDVTHKTKKFRENWATSEIATLAVALKTLTESKYKSLCIHDWNIKMVEEEVDNSIQGQIASEEDKGWTIEVMGGHNMTNAEVERMLTNYLDKPEAPA